MKHKIIINNLGQVSLNNSSFYNGITDNSFPLITSNNTNNNAIDIYLLSPNDSYSRANGIPGTALAEGGVYQGTSVLSHELGHCLGLFHTHSGSGCNDNANCAENTNESNCSTCGDLICDTPADPCLSGNVDNNCKYIGNANYHPDVHNIMSYAPPTCLNRLTVGQTLRIHNTIINNCIFYSRGYVYMSGSNLVCSSGTQFTINNLPSGYTVSWTYSSNLTSYYGGTNFIALKANSNGSGWVKATLIGTCGSIVLLQYNVWVGTPLTISSLDGEEVGYPNACTNETLHLTIDDNNVSSLTNYIWALGGATMTYHNSNYSYVIAKVSSVPTMYDFQIKASNSCGTLPVKHFTGQVQSCGGAQLALSPNPTSNNVQVSIIYNPTTVLSSDTTSTISSQTTTGNSNVITYTINIYNNFGTLFYSTKKMGDTFTIPVSSFKDGTYIVEANDGKQSYSQQLIIKH